MLFFVVLGFEFGAYVLSRSALLRLPSVQRVASEWPRKQGGWQAGVCGKTTAVFSLSYNKLSCRLHRFVISLGYIFVCVFPFRPYSRRIHAALLQECCEKAKFVNSFAAMPAPSSSTTTSTVTTTKISPNQRAAPAMPSSNAMTGRSSAPGGAGAGPGRGAPPPSVHVTHNAPPPPVHVTHKAAGRHRRRPHLSFVLTLSRLLSSSHNPSCFVRSSAAFTAHSKTSSHRDQ
jgi:hypothetical protein